LCWSVSSFKIPTSQAWHSAIEIWPIVPTKKRSPSDHWIWRAF
jgi:hypothetical protein